jgi:hypothetical protein
MAGQRFRTRLAAFTSIVAGFLTLFVLTLALASRAEAFVYWADHGTGTIGRANLDGTGADQRFITRAGDPDQPGGVLLGGVAVGAAHVYWTDENGGTIGRANLNGTGADRSFITGLGSPGGVAVDAAHVYWTNLVFESTIGRANLDGTGVDHSFVAGLSSPVGVAVDAEHIYWDNFDPGEGGSAIGRANLDGTGVDRSFVTGRPRLPIGAGVAVDAAHLYWHGFVTIGRARLSGTGIDRNFIDVEATFGGCSCNGVAVDGLGPPPSNAFSFGKAKKNRQKGTAKLTVRVPGPGTLKLTRTESLKGARTFADVRGTAKLPVKPRGKAKQKLAARGKAKVKAKVTYTPEGGEPNTQSKLVRLVKRR